MKGFLGLSEGELIYRKFYRGVPAARKQRENKYQAEKNAISTGAIRLNTNP